jgi:hypothetical protein
MNTRSRLTSSLGYGEFRESWAIADPDDPEAAEARARLEEARRGLRAVRPSC